MHCEWDCYWKQCHCVMYFLFSCNLKYYGTAVLCRYKPKSVAERTCVVQYCRRYFVYMNTVKLLLCLTTFLHICDFRHFFIRTWPDVHKNNVTYEQFLYFPNFMFSRNLHFIFLVIQKICLTLHFIIRFADFLLVPGDGNKR